MLVTCRSIYAGLFMALLRSRNAKRCISSAVKDNHSDSCDLLHVNPRQLPHSLKLSLWRQWLQPFLLVKNSDWTGSMHSERSDLII